jgi:hypothetical protein
MMSVVGGLSNNWRANVTPSQHSIVIVHHDDVADALPNDIT